MKKNILVLSISIFIFFISVKSISQTDEYVLNDTIVQNIKLFGNDEPIYFTLKSDFKKFKKEKFKEKYQPAQLIYKINDSIEVNKNVRIKARGEFRKKHCNFPPIRLNWRKTEIVKNEFVDYYKLKMVTHCNSSEHYEQYILKEYLCYKLYNIISDKSFRARLINITYIDEGHRKKKEIKTWSFFIEDYTMLAERCNSYKLKNEKLGMFSVEEQNLLEFSMFMFMIGNADWSVTGLHNLKLLKSKNFQQTKAFAVPYDFDYTGIVNASYAIPDENRLGISHITERVYLGPCKSEDKFKPIIKKFNTHKNEFYDLIESFEYLKEQSKAEMIEYLDEFFSIINSKNFHYNYLKSHCRTVD